MLVRPPFGVWKLSVVALRDKDQSLGLSRLVYSFLALGQYLIPLGRVKGQISAIFRENLSFSTSIADIDETMKDSEHGAFTSVTWGTWGFHQRISQTILYKMTCILKHLRRYCRRISHGKPTGHVCRPAASAAGRPLRPWEVRCSLYYYENDISVSQMDIGIEFRTPRNPHRHKNCIKVNLVIAPTLTLMTLKRSRDIPFNFL